VQQPLGGGKKGEAMGVSVGGWPFGGAVEHLT